MTQGNSFPGFAGFPGAASPVAAVSSQVQQVYGDPYALKTEYKERASYLPIGTFGVEILGIVDKQSDKDAFRKFIVKVRVLASNVLQEAPVGFEAGVACKVTKSAINEIKSFFMAAHGLNPKDRAAFDAFSADIGAMVRWAAAEGNPLRGRKVLVQVQRFQVKDKLTRIPVPDAFWFAANWAPCEQ